VKERALEAWKLECLQEMPWISGLSLVETRAGKRGVNIDNESSKFQKVTPPL